MQCGTMTCHDAGVVLGMVVPLVIGCVLLVVGGMKLLDVIDRRR